VGGVLPQRLRPLVAGDTTGDLATGSAGRRLDRLALTRAVCLRSENRLLASSHVMSGHCCHRLHASAADSGAGEGAGEGMSSSVDGTVVDVGSPSTAGASAAVSAWIVSVGDRAGDVGAGLASAADALAGEPAGDEADDDGVGSAISTDGSAASAEGAGLMLVAGTAVIMLSSSVGPLMLMIGVDGRLISSAATAATVADADGGGVAFATVGLAARSASSSSAAALASRRISTYACGRPGGGSSGLIEAKRSRDVMAACRSARKVREALRCGTEATRWVVSKKKIGQFGTISTDLGKRLQLLVLSLGCDRVAALLGSRSERLATDVGQCVLSFDAHGVALEVIQPATSEISRVNTEEPGEVT
jgi:hypothetical protein